MGRELGARDVMITGMGFCLPGVDQPVCTAADLWKVASEGRFCLTNDGIYHGSVKIRKEEFRQRVPGIPGTFSKHFTKAQWFGLLSLAEASADAGLNIMAGDLTDAAVLAGRGGIDANIDGYLRALHADAETITAREALDVHVGSEQSASPSDVALVQSALARSTGPSFTVSAGCASSAVQLNSAFLMIGSGLSDIAVVTGTDVFNAELARKAQQLLRIAQRGMAGTASPELPSFDRPMRPYDRRGGCVNFGEGSATLILESREHAVRRGADCYGRMLSGAMARDGLAHPLASDDTGIGLVAAVRRCLGNRWDIAQVPYVHGASDGDAMVTAFECSAIRQLYGPAADGLLMTSQEACFGHNGAPAGCLGVGLTLLMMRHGEVCPTANCEDPAEGLPFDPVPGTKTRPLDFGYALNLTYQIGGVKNAILLGLPDAA
ncbi:MAG TPA: beta-ketoacyl synthase N-terminal-like domain-containing protein [Trebonia sp.]|nr:beta-ketoacyl synthase N-terminal-like domain-containing protein [Trebonia sp.]